MIQQDDFFEKQAGDVVRLSIQLDPDRDFPEDSAHENGNYTCMCTTCKHYFTGHKRRVTCKLCSKNDFTEEKLQAKIDNVDKMVQINLDIIKELSAAEAKHSWADTNLIKQGLILSEEAGEVSQAILNFDEGKGSLDNIRNELLQTAAMCYRILKNLPK